MRVARSGSPGSVAPDGAERDPGAADVLRVLLENHARFLSFLVRRVGSRDDAEDILQEAFVRSLEHTASLPSSTSAITWFYRVLRNAMTDHYRRKESRGRALEQLAAESDPSDPADSELEAVVCACVLSLFDTLKPEYAAAIRQVDLDGASVRAYSEEAGITPSNGGVRLHRAREALRRQLARCCGTCLTHGCLDCQCQSGGLQGQA
ncbi:MAG TPA: sigma-70 family RNA polymerase sigma factor [Gemmatimonadales bacterium]|nr:sigma-70 family RNA polymerase sigma factor [Gemmatimonadales bacterium]